MSSCLLALLACMAVMIPEQRRLALIIKVLEDLLPLGFVEEEGFRQLMAFVEPEYLPQAWKKKQLWRGQEVRREPH